MGAVTNAGTAAALGEAILAELAGGHEEAKPTRSAIVGAAVESFADRGFHGTNLKHIAQGSGLSTAALYVHFASKEELLFALSRRGHEIALDMVTAAAGVADAVTAARVFVYAFTRWHAEQRTLARVVQYELGALRAEHADVITDLRRDTEKSVRGLVERGVGSGDFVVPDVRGAAAAILSLGIDVARWYTPHSPWTPHELGVLYIEFASRLLGVRG
ncbi:TetR/AcrR family transcriptional regulator [Pseudonocardia ailaonensis]|uniref:TetR/AcrR family transcriptional regulator n=1 Tax=Pseudonocardia ailaonensis TaxID=367279 RepID=A0ABN2N014_9PSEU